MSSPVGRARENVTGIVSMLVTGIWLAALVSGQEWWLPVMLVGYIVVVPVVAILAGDEEEEVTEWTGGDRESGRAQAEPNSQEDALQTLRSRYARGELTDEQFERKLEQLLETETLEDVEARKRRARERRSERDGREREVE